MLDGVGQSTVFRNLIVRYYVPPEGGHVNEKHDICASDYAGFVDPQCREFNHPTIYFPSATSDPNAMGTESVPPLVAFVLNAPESLDPFAMVP